MGATIAAVIGAAAAAASTGYALSGAGQPTPPNLASSSAKMAQTQAQLLPIIRKLQAAAQLGQKGSLDLPEHEGIVKMVRVPVNYGVGQGWNGVHGGVADLINLFGGSDGEKQVPYVESEWAPGGKYAGLLKEGQTAPRIYDRTKKIAAGKQDYDFSGYSQADIEGTISKALAQGQLDLSKKYDAAFIQSALDEQKLADPQSVEARQRLYDLIQQQAKNPPSSPVADEMSRQVQDRVSAGAGLTAEEQALLDDAVRSGSADRGGGGPAADFADDLTTGFKGENRALAAGAAGTRWLSSGQTPEDIAYRARQQDMSNLSKFVSGQTPEAEFAQLSGAQQGPTPVVRGPALPTLNPNASQQGAAGAAQQYGAQVNQSLNQPNQWLAGISGVLGALKTAGAAGWAPLATQRQTA